MRPNLGGFLDDALGLLIFFQIAILLQLVLIPYSVYSSGSLAWYEAEIFGWLAPLSPILLIFLLYAWAFRGVVQAGRKRSVWLDRIAQPFSVMVKRVHLSSASLGNLRILSHPRLLLIIAMVAAGLLGYIPYRPDLNPNGNLVGVDTPVYVYWTKEMLSRPPLQAVSFAFGGADQGFRPLLLIIFYSIASAGVSPEQIAKFSPVVLGPLLSLSSYVFVKSGSGDMRMAAVAALAASFSFNITVGIWAGYLANWLAIVISYFFLAGFLVFARSKRKAAFVVVTLLSLAMFLTHPWTWAVILAGTLVFAFTRERRRREFLTGSVFAWISVGIVVDILKSQATGGTTLAADLGTKAPVFGVPELLMFWPNLWGALTVFYNGLLGNAFLLGLSALPFLGIRFREDLEGLLTCWVASASIPFALLNSFHQTRLIYDLPVPALAMMSLLILMSKSGGSLRATLIFLVLLLFTANYAMSSTIQA